MNSRKEHDVEDTISISLFIMAAISSFFEFTSKLYFHEMSRITPGTTFFLQKFIVPGIYLHTSEMAPA